MVEHRRRSRRRPAGRRRRLADRPPRGAAAGGGAVPAAAFVTDASHELRTPLTVLHTRAQVLRRRLGRTGDAGELAEIDQLVDDTSVARCFSLLGLRFHCLVVPRRSLRRLRTHLLSSLRENCS